MKKALIIALCLVFVVATVAFAGIRNSKHDLSSSGNQAIRSSNINEICVFCHTPHASNTSMTAAPLWNRNDNSTTWSNDNAYSTPTMNGTSSSPSTANAISKACLSCHDGNVGDETLVNGPGSGTSTTISWVANVITSVANLNDSAGLTNDHPIGLDMASIAGVDNGIYDAPSDSNLRLFNGLVECATCHSVHNSTAYQPFLATSNAGSAMCLACHDK
jgi:predicted CXXCH cytochrome family protein